MNDYVSDSRMATKLKRRIREIGQWDKIPNIYHCGSQVIKQLGSQPAVFIMKNDKNEVRTFGHTSCHSAWACPKCTAKVMAQKGVDIGSAIDALAKQKKLYAFMITFTIPHTKTMTAEESLTILQKTWRQFSRGGAKHYKRTRTYTRNKDQTKRRHPNCKDKEETTITYNDFRNPLNKMRTELNIKYFVKVYEFTWSDDNSWHPHIHALFWTHKDNFDKILNYQDKLFEHWWKSAKEQTAKTINRDFAEELYTDWRKEPITGHRSVFISTNKEGKVIKQSSSMYIC